MEERVYIEEKIYALSWSFKRIKQGRVSMRENKAFVERVFWSSRILIKDVRGG